MKRRTLAFVVVWAVGLATGSLIAPTFSAFSSVTTNVGNTFQGAADWVAPNVPASVIRKGSGGVGGFIKQGGTYRVFANVSDAGNPASGTTSVAADVSAITSGQTAVALASGSWTVDGVAYNYRSAELTANAILTDGSKSYTVSTVDAAGNTRTKSGLSVSVDNIIPAGTDIQAENTSGGTLGRAEQGDSITYTFTERIEPGSILAGWDGTPTGVVVRFINNGGGGSSANDRVQIWNSTDSSQLPLGQIDTNGNFVSGSLTFGASGTESTMQQTGSVIAITLGSVSDAGSILTNGNDTQLWTPSSAATDLAGNNCDVSVVTELGILDRDF